MQKGCQTVTAGHPSSPRQYPKHLEDIKLDGDMVSTVAREPKFHACEFGTGGRIKVIKDLKYGLAIP